MNKALLMGVKEEYKNKERTWLYMTDLLKVSSLHCQNYGIVKFLGLNVLQR